MTGRELRLRNRIDKLADELEAERDRTRKLTRDLMATRRRPAYGFCVLCGTPCYGRACTAHRDLLYNEERVYRLTTAPAPTLVEADGAGAEGGNHATD